MRRLYNVGIPGPVAAVVLCGGLLWGCRHVPAADPATAQDAANKFTPPPAAETAEVKALIDRAQAATRAGKNGTDLLTDPAFLAAHEWPRFRELARKSANSARLTIVTPREPGDALVVRGKVSDRQGKPVPGALLYLYQTSARGWYSDRAAHISGHEGDRKHARLFGYLTTDPGGGFELRTVRPGGYPESNLPAHIHVEVQPPGDGAWGMATEILFEDDPRLTETMRDRSLREGFLICSVRRGPGQVWETSAELRLR